MNNKVTSTKYVRRGDQGQCFSLGLYTSPPVFDAKDWKRDTKKGAELDVAEGDELHNDDENTWHQVMMMVVKDMLFHDERKNCQEERRNLAPSYPAR